MILKNNEKKKSQFTQRYDKCPNNLPFLNADHAIFFVLLFFVINIPDSGEEMLTPCYQFAAMLYENRPLLFKVP